jgi:two-component system phosphate regulon sensor histidine kinase PhoR
MNRIWQYFFHPLFVFIMAQIAWLSLLGLWIYWYISNYIILKQVGDNLSPQIVSKSTNIIALVWGLILLVLVLGGMYFIFIFLAKQINLSRRYDNFIANVTHELRSPLASIQLYLETMSIREVDRDKQNQFVSMMLKDVLRLQNLIDSILRLSGIEKKKSAYDYHVYRIDEEIRILVGEAIAKFNVRPNSIQIEGNGNCKGVLDREGIRVVIDNLIDNAIKFSRDTFKLLVQMSCDKAKFCMSFTDQGIGISTENQKKIFHRFYRIYGQDIPNIQGTGLGLHMVREIVKGHGGSISVFSEGKNKGSTFTIELPVYQKSKKRYLNYLLKQSQKQEMQQHGE